MSVATTAPLLLPPAESAPAMRLQVLPTPQWEPPYDDELPDCPPPVTGTLPLPFDRTTARRLRLVVTEPEGRRADPFDRARTPRSQLPDPRAWGHRLAQAVAEVLDGVRPLGQLLRWTSEDVFEEVEARLHRTAAYARRTGTPAQQRRRQRTIVGSVHLCEPADGIAELSTTIRREGRVTAIALRLEGLDGRWLCTALQ